MMFWKFSSMVVALLLVCAFSTEAADKKSKSDGDLIDKTNPLQLVLPKRIYGAVGVEMNVYFENVALMVNRANFLFDVDCNIGRQQQERWTHTPTKEQVGEYLLKIKVFDQTYRQIAAAETKLKIVDPATVSQDKQTTTTMLMIGDSLTAASRYPQRVIKLSQQNKFPQLKLIGTTGPGKKTGQLNRHEGRGGWTAQRFITAYSTGESGFRSPFLFPDDKQKPVLNFQRYCQEQNQGHAPDVATIFLGPNDIFGATQETINERIDVMLKHFDQLINMVHRANPQSLVGVMLPVPPAATQDAFGANYKTGKPRWEYRRHQHLLRTRMLARYGRREKERLYIVPIAVNLDCLHNYPSVVQPANAHAAGKITRLSNGVHPASSGYDQIGDSLYSWLVCQLKQMQHID